MGIRFRVLACPVDASTGDRRRFAENAITHQDLPMPLGWVYAEQGGHDGAVTVGTIDGVELEGAEVWVSGEIFTADDPDITETILEDAKSALFLARKGVVGPSVDLDDFDAMPVRVGSDEPLTLEDLEDEDLEVEMLVTKGRMRSATLVRIPAFVETNHTMQFEENEDDEAEAEPDDPAISDDEDLASVGMVFAASGDTQLPVVEDREHEWDGGAAAGRIFDAYEDDEGNVDKAQAGKAFLWVDNDGTKRGDYKLGFADLVDGELKIIPRGVAATAGGRGVDSTDNVDRDAIKQRICSLYATVRKTFDDWPECPFEETRKDDADDKEPNNDGMGDAASRLVTATIGYRDAALFTPPFEPANPIRITYDFERGQVYGHIAPWGVCHAGIQNACVLAPRAGEGNYRDFHTHRVETTEGTVYAGRITIGGDHAARDGSLGAHAVRQVYDDKKTIAYVRAVEDEFGIFVCGPLLATDPGEIPKIARPLGDGRFVMEHAVSGDWRETVDGMALIEVLALEPGPPESSQPGFPIPSMRVGFAAGRQVALTASLMPPVMIEGAKTIDAAEVFRQTAQRLVLEELEKAQAAGVARAELQIIIEADDNETNAALRRELLRAIGD